MEEANTSKPCASQAKKLKKIFLNNLQNAPSIETALQDSGLNAARFFYLLEKDAKFRLQFEKIINLKLEISFLDAALKTKSPTILSFALTNRLAEKYNKSKAGEAGAAAAPAQIIFEQTYGPKAD